MEGSDFYIILLHETYLPILSAGAEKQGKNSTRSMLEHGRGKKEGRVSEGWEPTGGQGSCR